MRDEYKWNAAGPQTLRRLADTAARTLRNAAAALRGASARIAPVESSIKPVSATTRERPEEQLDRLTSVVSLAAQHGERAHHLHDRAGLRVDAALYELDQLRLHLEEVLGTKMPERIAGRAENASLAGTPAVAAAPETKHNPSPEPQLGMTPLKVGPAGSSRSAA